MTAPITRRVATSVEGGTAETPSLMNMKLEPHSATRAARRPQSESDRACMPGKFPPKLVLLLQTVGGKVALRNVLAAARPDDAVVVVPVGHELDGLALER